MGHGSGAGMERPPGKEQHISRTWGLGGLRHRSRTENHAYIHYQERMKESEVDMGSQGCLSWNSLSYIRKLTLF